MTYAEFRAEQQRLEALMAEQYAIVNAAPKHPNGLTIEAFKSPEWVAAYHRAAQIFAAYRKLNQAHAKRFKKEIRAEIDEKRMRQIAKNMLEEVDS